jgi:3-dehydrosphinganine reductase
MEVGHVKLQGRTAFITGGSSGIGLACAKLAAAAGANVAIFSRDAKRLEDAVGEIRRMCTTPGTNVRGYQLDVSDHAEAECVIKRASAEMGEPFVLVNSAGLGGAFNFDELPYERFDRTMKINVYGIRNTIAAILPFMKKRGGYIVNVSSIGGLLGVFGYTAYSASKFAVIGFSECLRAELKRYNIIVSVLCPPDTDTPMMREPDTIKPRETIAISGNAGLKSAEYVAVAMYRGMAKKRFVIIPGIGGKAVFLAKRLFPRLIESLMDRTIRQVQEDYL